MSNKFNYKYTAPTEDERREIDSIRRQYTPSDNGETSESKLQRLRRLDALVKNTAVIWSLCFGIVGVLIFGLGFSMILQWNIIPWGVAVAVVGCAPMAIAYPVYKKILKIYKERYSEEILKLSEELLNEEKN